MYSYLLIALGFKQQWTINNLVRLCRHLKWLLHFQWSNVPSINFAYNRGNIDASEYRQILCIITQQKYYLVIFIKSRKGDKIQIHLLYKFIRKMFRRGQYLIELKENFVGKCYNRLVLDWVNINAYTTYDMR